MDVGTAARPLSRYWRAGCRSRWSSRSVHARRRMGVVRPDGRGGACARVHVHVHAHARGTRSRDSRRVVRILVVVVVTAAAASSGLVLLALAVLVVSMVLVMMLRMCMCMCMRMRMLLLVVLLLLLLTLLLLVLLVLLAGGVIMRTRIPGVVLARRAVVHVVEISLRRHGVGYAGGRKVGWRGREWEEVVAI